MIKYIQFSVRNCHSISCVYVCTVPAPILCKETEAWAVEARISIGSVSDHVRWAGNLIIEFKAIVSTLGPFAIYCTTLAWHCNLLLFGCFVGFFFLVLILRFLLQYLHPVITQWLPNKNGENAFHALDHQIIISWSFKRQSLFFTCLYEQSSSN